MPDDDLRSCPSCCNHGNACGATSDYYTEGVGVWDKWYDAARVSLAEMVPGSEIKFDFTITADHGGQSWIMLSCADHIAEGLSWTILERAVSDRTHHFMPSNPGIYAWAKDEAAQTMGDVITATWVVPEHFSCPSGRGVGRWVWKTSNSCNDVNNIGKDTETFNIDEFAQVFHSYSPGDWILETCGDAPETFVSCFDFTTQSGPSPSPIPVPLPIPLPSPQPIPAPSPPGRCQAISALVTDDWCDENCALGNCPKDLCKCNAVV